MYKFRLHFSCRI